MGRKLGGRALPPFWEGELGPQSSCNTMSIGSWSTFLPSGILIHPAIWLQQLWAENWGLCPFGRRGARSSSNTMWPWPRHTCVPSFILIHPTIWPRYTMYVTYRQDRQWSDRIGRTVLQTVAQTYHLLIVFDLRYSLILCSCSNLLTIVFAPYLKIITRHSSGLLYSMCTLLIIENVLFNILVLGFGIL